MSAAIEEDRLVKAAAEAARAASDGANVEFTTLCLQAIASQRDAARRHEMARQAWEQAGSIALAGLTVLRTVFMVATI